MQVLERSSELNTSSRIIEEYLAVMRREVNPTKDYERVTKLVLSRINLQKAIQDNEHNRHVATFLDSLRKPESIDPLHKWVGTYNLYVIILKRFFRWFTHSNNPKCMEGIKKLKRKET